MVGTAFLYTNKESLTLGIGCLVSDFKQKKIPPYQLLEDFKKHPVIRPLLEGGEMKEYAAHMIPEGGYKAIPQLTGDGWVACGDAAHFNNAAHREGSNLAMTSGRLAAEAILELRKDKMAMSGGNLAYYKRKLEDSFLMKDLKKYRNLPDTLHAAPQFFTQYPDLIANAMKTWFTVDNIDKKTKEKQIMRSFLGQRSLLGLTADVLKLVRASR
jgi:electron transfer flavoprotein-quinone oxidoreductase